MKRIILESVLRTGEKWDRDAGFSKHLGSYGPGAAQPPRRC